MTAEEFRRAVQDLLARPVDQLSTEDKAAVVRGCVGNSSVSTSWLSPELLGQLWMIGLPLLALLTRLDWWLLSLIWIVAASAFFLVALLPGVEPREAGAGQRITEDEFRSGVHHLLARPVDDLSVEDKAEAIRACLADMKQEEKPPWWSRAMQSLAGYLLQFAGVATVAVLFPGLAWFWWLLLGIVLGVLVAVLLMLVIRGVRRLVKPAGQQVPAESPFGEQAVRPRDHV
jgi:hypothetical protein